MDTSAACELLNNGRIEVEGRLVDASNATLFCKISLDGVDAQCVYKPVRGERPLWDFPDGTLAGREVARLASGDYGPGEHAVEWIGRDGDGRLLPSGTYLYRLRTPGVNLVRKLVLVR